MFVKQLDSYDQCMSDHLALANVRTSNSRSVKIN